MHGNAGHRRSSREKWIIAGLCAVSLGAMPLINSGTCSSMHRSRSLRDHPLVPGHLQCHGTGWQLQYCRMDSPGHYQLPVVSLRTFQTPIQAQPHFPAGLFPAVGISGPGAAHFSPLLPAVLFPDEYGRNTGSRDCPYSDLPA